MFVRFHVDKYKTILLNSAKIYRVEEKCEVGYFSGNEYKQSVIYYIEKGNIEIFQVEESLEEVERILNQALDHDAYVRSAAYNASQGNNKGKVL